MNSIIVGIDLGTSNCCISYINDEGKIEIIKDKKYPDKITLPSLVDVTLIKDNMVLIGNEIPKNYYDYSKSIFHNFKRLIGHTVDDTYSTNLKEILTYKIDNSNNSIVCFDENNNCYSITEIIFLLLRKIKNIIDEHFKPQKRKWECIVTIPAYFNEIQRQITLDAIKIANLPFIKLLNEPTSASFAYLFYNKILELSSINKKLLVIDYGAGTLDLTVLEISRNDTDMSETICEVLGIYGDNNFGGLDITKKIYKTLFNKGNANTNEYDENLYINMQIAEEIKLILSSQQNAKYYSSILNKTFEYPYDVFLVQMKEFSNHIIKVIDEVLKISELNKSDIDDIVLVGGSFKNLYFRKEIANYFRKDILQPKIKINNNEILLYEDIAVSVGAAIHGYYLFMTKDVILVDRLPLSIGIETVGKQVAKIIERNTIIPTSKTKTFEPEEFGQKFININIYQGESMFTENCNHIANFTINNLPISITNLCKPKIFIKINIDHNGIISINAYDKKNIFDKTIKITTESIALTEDKIEEIINRYDQTLHTEQLHKEIIRNYYDLINIIDKISHQLNYNSSLNLTDDIKDVMKNDIEMIINKINNPFIIKKYNINSKIIKKIIIINNLKINESNIQDLTNEQIEEFSKFSLELFYYLLDRYGIYLDVEYQKYNEVINDIMETKEIYHDLCDPYDVSSNSCDNKIIFFDEINKSNEIDKSDKIDITDILKDNFDHENDYYDLCSYLKTNISTFNINSKGVTLLLNKLDEPVLDSNYENRINEINELCIYLKNTHMDN